MRLIYEHDFVMINCSLLQSILMIDDNEKFFLNIIKNFINYLS